MPDMIPLSDQLLARIVALAADAIICTDSKHRVTFFNDGAVRIFGFDASDVIGQPLSKLLPARFREVHDQHVEEFRKSPVAARQMGERSLISGLRANGEEFPAEAAIAKMDGPNGAVFSVVLRDVTIQRQAELLNRQLHEETVAALKAREELLGLVSHDLRNPVNAVKMLAAAIVRTSAEDTTGRIPADISNHASVMLHAASQMDALIQDLLDVTRLDAGKMRLNVLPCDLEEVTKVAVQTMMPSANEKGVSVELELPAGAAFAMADPDRIIQVLCNLIGNSIKFTSRGGSVRIVEQVIDNQHVIRVVDSGIGIPADELPLVFDRFWQSKRTNRSGAGLGLAIARGIVLAHGGTINVESTLGAGTIVQFTLACAAD